jgi:hypothetical protein
MAVQLGVKQKSLFDQLVEDQRTLDQVAGEAEAYSVKGREAIQKTFVLSRMALESLNEVARKRRLPRDLLVEVSIRRLIPVVSAEKEKQAKREGVLSEVVRIREGAISLLGEEDPVVERLETLGTVCDRIVTEIAGIVDRGKCLDRLKSMAPRDF